MVLVYWLLMLLLMLLLFLLLMLLSRGSQLVGHDVCIEVASRRVRHSTADANERADDGEDGSGDANEHLYGGARSERWGG